MLFTIVKGFQRMQKSCSRKKKTITNSFTLPLQKTNFLMNMTTFSSPKILRQNSLMVEAIWRRKTDSSGLLWKPQDDGNGSSVAAAVTGGLPAEFYNFFWTTWQLFCSHFFSQRRVLTTLIQKKKSLCSIKKKKNKRVAYKPFELWLQNCSKSCRDKTERADQWVKT